MASYVDPLLGCPWGLVALVWVQYLRGSSLPTPHCAAQESKHAGHLSSLPSTPVPGTACIRPRSHCTGGILLWPKEGQRMPQSLSNSSPSYMIGPVKMSQEARGVVTRWGHRGGRCPIHQHGNVPGKEASTSCGQQPPHQDSFPAPGPPISLPTPPASLSPPLPLAVYAIWILVLRLISPPGQRPAKPDIFLVLLIFPHKSAANCPSWGPEWGRAGLGCRVSCPAPAGDSAGPAAPLDRRGVVSAGDARGWGKKQHLHPVCSPLPPQTSVSHLGRKPQPSSLAGLWGKVSDSHRESRGAHTWLGFP